MTCEPEVTDATLTAREAKLLEWGLSLCWVSILVVVYKQLPSDCVLTQQLTFFWQRRLLHHGLYPYFLCQFLYLPSLWDVPPAYGFGCSGFLSCCYHMIPQRSTLWNDACILSHNSRLKPTTAASYSSRNLRHLATSHLQAGAES